MPSRGPSPRVRGKRAREQGVCGGNIPPSSRFLQGSIPACAGETSNQWLSSSDPIPACAGETCKDVARGPSPRVRGKRGKVDPFHLCNGVHPRVCGGNSRRYCNVHFTRVHPRVCGGNATVMASRWRGPSPRVRGKPVQSRAAGPSRSEARRPIPACAGETRARGPRSVRGGSIPACAGETSFCEYPPTQRSIPACAGETPCR